MNNIKSSNFVTFRVIAAFLFFLGVHPADRTASFSFCSSFRRVRAAENLSPIRVNHTETIEVYPAIINPSATAAREESLVKVGYFADGEIKIQLTQPSLIYGATVNVRHSLRTADDYLEILLLAGTLRQYGAAEISLALEDWHPQLSEASIDSDLIRILKIFCNTIMTVGPNGDNIEHVRAPKEYRPIQTLTGNSIDSLFFADVRFKKMAEAVAGEKTTQISIIEEEGFHWRKKFAPGMTVNDIRGRSVALISSTDSAENIIKTALTLFALREHDAKAVFLINTYQGYARQDRINPDNPGEGVSADIILQLLNRFTDYTFAINVHYGDKTGVTTLSQGDRVIRNELRGDDYPRNPDEGQKIQTLPARKVFNLNGFVQVAEQIVENIVNEYGANALAERPLVIVTPDDGAYLYAEEANRIMKDYIYRRWGLKSDVVVGYLPKTRINGVVIRENIALLTVSDEEGGSVPLKIPGNVSLNDSWVLLLDELIAGGSTTLSAEYCLVKYLGADWNKIYAGAVHGQFTGGLEQFVPGYIDEEKGLMAPRQVVVTESLESQFDLSQYPNIQVAPIDRLVSFAIRRILGQRVPLSELGLP